MGYDISKVINIALGEVGYLEKKSNSQLDSKTANAGYNNYTKYARDLDNMTNFYNSKKNGYYWCDIFVDWCFCKAYGREVAQKLLCQPDKSLGAGCKYSYEYFKKKGQVHSTPKVGDQIFFKNSSGSITHTGLVYKVSSTTVHTIEGNTSGTSGVEANGGGVFKKSYEKNYSRIVGYGRPSYGEQPKTAPKKAPNEMVKKGQKYSNMFLGSKHTIKVDGYSGRETRKQACKVLQHALNKDYNPKPKLTIDGDIGSRTNAVGFGHYVEEGECQYLVSALEIIVYMMGIDAGGYEAKGKYDKALARAIGEKVTFGEMKELIKKI